MGRNALDSGSSARIVADSLQLRPSSQSNKLGLLYENPHLSEIQLYRPNRIENLKNSFFTLCCNKNINTYLVVLSITERVAPRYISWIGAEFQVWTEGLSWRALLQCRQLQV